MTRERDLALIAGTACMAALAVALGSEKWLGLVPCAFCLLERQPYEAGLLLTLAALLVPRHFARALLWVVFAAMLVAVSLSVTHVGVEKHWWPDPLPACTVPDFAGMTTAQRLAAMPARPAKPCEDPDYLIPGLPVSMAQMALLYALAVSASLAISLSRRQGRRFR